MASSLSEQSAVGDCLVGLPPPPPRPPSLPPTHAKRRRLFRRRSSSSPSPSGGAKLSTLDAACKAARALEVMTKNSPDFVDPIRRSRVSTPPDSICDAEEEPSPSSEADPPLALELESQVIARRLPPNLENPKTDPKTSPMRIILRKPKPSRSREVLASFTSLMSALDSTLPAIHRIAEDDANYDRQSEIATSSLVILGSLCKNRISPILSPAFQRLFLLLRDVLHDALFGYPLKDTSNPRHGLSKAVANARAHQKRWTWCDQTIRALRANSGSDQAAYNMRYLNLQATQIWRKCDPDLIARRLAKETDAPIPSVRAVRTLINEYSELLSVLIDTLYGDENAA